MELGFLGLSARIAGLVAVVLGSVLGFCIRRRTFLKVLCIVWESGFIYESCLVRISFMSFLVISL
jgi:hypothetical protein